MGFAEEINTPERTPIVMEVKRSVPLTPASAACEDNQWSTGLCECSAQPGGGALGCVSLFMPCVQYGVLAEQLPKGSTFLACSFCNAASMFFILDIVASLAHMSIWPGVNLLPTSALMHMEMRKHLRTKYGIKGSFLGDLCTTWWCGPCALAQETREIVIRAQRQQQQEGAIVSTQQSIHMLGHMIMMPPGLMAPLNMATPTPVGILMVDPAPVTGIPAGYSAVPPTYVATAGLPVPGKDTAAPALAN